VAARAAVLPSASGPAAAKASGSVRGKHVLCIWSDEEIGLVISGLKTHGRNFGEIAKGLGGSKSITQVRNWYHNYRRKYNLDQYLDAGKQKPL
jgi:hypothetical protein